MDDITNGYDNCCCKEVIFKQLRITNHQQKHDEYLRLKHCLDSPQSANINKNTVSTMKTFDKLFKDMIEIFTVLFTEQIANNIVQLFNEVLIDNGVCVIFQINMIIIMDICIFIINSMKIWME